MTVRVGDVVSFFHADGHKHKPVDLVRGKVKHLGDGVVLAGHKHPFWFADLVALRKHGKG